MKTAVDKIILVVMVSLPFCRTLLIIDLEFISILLVIYWEAMQLSLLGGGLPMRERIIGYVYPAPIFYFSYFIAINLSRGQ